MGREMIDWNKPIETVDGRKATIRHERKVGPTAKVFIVEIDPPAGGVFGFAYMVDELGRRCDDFAAIDPPVLIRNVRVKREGWGRVNSNGGLPFMIGDVVFSEKASAEAACQKLGGIPAFITWEE
jgi:hypothetical protein